MVGRGHGEFERGGVARDEAGQVSVASARELCVESAVCCLRKVVCVDGQGQSLECLANTVRCFDIPSEYNSFGQGVKKLFLIVSLFLFCSPRNLHLC